MVMSIGYYRRKKHKLGWLSFYLIGNIVQRHLWPIRDHCQETFFCLANFALVLERWVFPCKPSLALSGRSSLRESSSLAVLQLTLASCGLSGRRIARVQCQTERFAVRQVGAGDDVGLYSYSLDDVLVSHHISWGWTVWVERWWGWWCSNDERNLARTLCYLGCWWSRIYSARTGLWLRAVASIYSRHDWQLVQGHFTWSLGCAACIKGFLIGSTVIGIDQPSVMIPNEKQRNYFDIRCCIGYLLPFFIMATSDAGSFVDWTHDEKRLASAAWDGIGTAKNFSAVGRSRSWDGTNSWVGGFEGEHRSCLTGIKTCRSSKEQCESQADRCLINAGEVMKAKSGLCQFQFLHNWSIYHSSWTGLDFG